MENQSNSSNSKPCALATQYLHTPAGWRAKFDKAANKYLYVKRVEREWFAHDPNLDGSESDGEVDAWSSGEWEDGVQDGLVGTKEACQDRGPQ